MASNARKGKERGSREVREKDRVEKEQETCQFCGCEELTVPCIEETCRKATHKWCAGLFSQGSGKPPLCKYHLCAAERVPVIPLRALLGQLGRGEVQLPVELRYKPGIWHIEASYGVVFWDYIGQMFFPQRAQWGKTSEVLDFAGDLTASWEPRSKGNNAGIYIEEELNYTLEHLAALYEFLDCAKAELSRGVAEYAQKSAEYLKKLPICPLPKPYNKHQYLLDEVSIPCHFPLYDNYSHYFLISHLTPPDIPESNKVSSLCMVCSATEHTETNVLVICSVRYQPGLRGVCASGVLRTTAGARGGLVL